MAAYRIFANAPDIWNFYQSQQAEGQQLFQGR
jgi:hypothetical protein